MSDLSDVTYHDLIAANRRNSVLLVAGFVLFVGLLAGVLAAAFLGGDPTAGVSAGVLALVVAGLMAVWSYYGGGSAILRMSGARLIEKKDDPQLYNVVDEMAIAGRSGFGQDEHTLLQGSWYQAMGPHYRLFAYRFPENGD